MICKYWGGRPFLHTKLTTTACLILYLLWSFGANYRGILPIYVKQLSATPVSLILISILEKPKKNKNAWDLRRNACVRRKLDHVRGNFVSKAYGETIQKRLGSYICIYGVSNMRFSWHSKGILRISISKKTIKKKPWELRRNACVRRKLDHVGMLEAMSYLKHMEKRSKRD